MRVKIISLPPYKNNLISSLRRNQRIDFDSSLKAERERLKYISQLNKASVNYHWKSYEGRSLKRGANIQGFGRKRVSMTRVRFRCSLRYMPRYLCHYY